MTFRNHWHLSEEFGPDGTDDGAMNSTVCYGQEQALTVWLDSCVDARRRGYLVDVHATLENTDGPFDHWYTHPTDGGVRYRAWPASERGDLYYCVSAGYADESDLIAAHEARHAFMASLRGPVMLSGDPRLGKVDGSNIVPAESNRLLHIWNAAADYEINADLTLQAVTAAQPGPFVCPVCGVTYYVVHGCLGAD